MAFGIVTLLFSSLFISCNKSDDPVVEKPVVEETKLTKEQGWSKQIHEAMREIYLWNDALPATFDPKKYATPEDALDYLIGLKIDPSTSKPIDRYSFLDKIGNLSGEIGGGTASGDYGFMVGYVKLGSGSIVPFVKYVYKNSPAGKAGVERGMILTKINGSTNVNHDGSSTGGSGLQNVVNALYYSTSAKFTFAKSDGNTFDADMVASSYAINSVLYSKVYTTASSKKVGYVVFNQFLAEPSVAELKPVISNFEAEGVKYVIVDLRYNGGGSVATCEAFCNFLAPASANGKLMYKYKMNSFLTPQFKQSDMETMFKKENTLEPTELYFIVSGSTASASELLINNLLPYYPGKIFLVGAKTYGKPCGFWATPIGYTTNQTTTKEGYDLYAVSFESVNALGRGGYYAGMTPGSTEYPGIGASDYMDLSWGDTQDDRLAQALYHIENGSFKATTKSAVQRLEVDIDRQFKGMVDYRKHK